MPPPLLRSTLSRRGDPFRRLFRVLAGERGQAAVEFVVLLPIIVLLALAGWQAVIVGQAVWMSGAAARAAARASALDEDPRAAARSVLPGSLAHGVRVKVGAVGSVTVHVPIPIVVVGAELTAVRARAHFAPQAG